MANDDGTRVPLVAPTLAETLQSPATASPSADTLVPAPQPPMAPAILPASSYRLGPLIGKGGMGEVVAAYDQRIGREVAIKRMRTATPDGEQLSRFLREARIQARLDHPAIVPVHELGTDEAGHPFFTMKRISGRTLAERMAGGASQQALLRALIDVCLAVELAHSRGVVHRDLKPSNIMMGDYGEVYVLDWGIARVIVDNTRDPLGDIDTLQDGTQTGAFLGTPGYMAPEQIKGDPADAAADVYALGAILFEILAGEPLHPRGQAAIANTLVAPRESPARRRPDRAIAPELDLVCLSALAETPRERPSARELADKIQAYLDGDRDVERRRALASEELARALAALADGSAARRVEAIAAAGRALALDPSSVEAMNLVTRLVVEPPDVLPVELEEELAREDRRATAQRSKAGVSAYLWLFAFWIVIPFLGVQSWGWLIALFAVIGFMAVLTWRASKTGVYNLGLGMMGNLVFAMVATRLAGPFLLVPVVLCGVLLAHTTSKRLNENRWLIVAWTAAAFLVPIGLEAAGILERTWWVRLTSIDFHSVIFQMEGRLADAALIVANIAFVAIVGLFGASIHRTAREARRRLHIQAWHMRHLYRRPLAARA